MALSYVTLPAVVLLVISWGTQLLAANPGAEQTFNDRCASCHRIKHDAPKSPLDVLATSGPALVSAGAKYQRTWLEEWLANPTRLRPGGYLPFKYTVSTSNGDHTAEDKIPTHPTLTPEEASEIAAFLMTLSMPIQPYPIDNSAEPLDGELYFHKLFACSACHQSHVGRGGRSAPELYTASKRLQRDWVSSFIHDPQYWQSHLMPKVSLRSEQIKALTDYIMTPKSSTSETAQSTQIATAEDLPRPTPDNTPQALYFLQCSACHGISGNGKGINAAHMEVKPRDHTSFEEMSKLTRDRAHLVIKFGGTSVGKSANMPPWSNVLQDKDMEALVSYLRRLSGVEF